MPDRMKTPQNVRDIGSAEGLIRYAVSGQVARLLDHSTSATVGKLAKAIGISASNFAHALTEENPRRLDNDNLRKLDEVIVALAPELDRVGTLASFAGRLRGLRGAFDRTSLIASIPSAWTRRVLDLPAQDELHVLIQASTLVSTFLAAHSAGRSSRTLRERYKDQIEEVAERLILIAGAPPTPSNLEAQILLGGLARFAYQIVWQKLDSALRETPLGFRVWRSITKLVLLARDDAWLTDQLRTSVRELLGEAGEFRKTSIYPGRSLDLELAISIPSSWSEPPDDWVNDVLVKRAYNTDATLRERATAATGIWQRACAAGRTDDPQVQKDLHQLIKHFNTTEQRSDITSGLRWVGATLTYVMDENVSVSNDWPLVDEPWFTLVEDATAPSYGENVPRHLREGTARLFRHVLLQNAGVYRRQAIDTLIASSWTEPIAQGLGIILKEESAEPWLRIRALFALGFLQHRDPRVARTLQRACVHAHHNIVGATGRPARAQITEMHAALFAMGDSYGAEDAAREARRVRDSVQDVLLDLVRNGRTTDEASWPIARALVYLLTFTAQPRTAPQVKDLSQELLEELQAHPDSITRDFCQWALRYRITEDGQVRSLLFAAD